MSFSTPAIRDYSTEPLPPDAIIAALAARQHGTVTVEQLHAAGLNNEAIRRRVLSGRLFRVHRGVYAVGHAALSFEGRCMAAVLACGEGSAVAYLTSAELMKVSRWPIGPITVVTRSQRRPAGVEVHCSLSLSPLDVWTFKGIPITTLPRTLIDLADTMTAHQLAFVIHQAAFRHRFDLEATYRALERANGRRGVKKVRQAIELYLSGSAGTRSAKEDAYLASLPAGERELVRVNTKLEVDFHWPDEQRVVEIDGSGHTRPPTRAEDAARDARLERAGIEVRRIDAR